MHPGPGRMAPLGQKGVCGEGGGHREGASGEEAAVSQQSGGIRSRRKRRDLGTWSEEEPSKLGSTCSGNESVMQCPSPSLAPVPAGIRACSSW